MTLKSLVFLFLLQWHYQAILGRCPQGAFVGLAATECYTLPLPKMSWWDAEQACWNVNGNLTSIPDATVNNFMHNVTGNLASDFWVGASNVINATWHWSDGTLFNYTNWQTGYEAVIEQRCLAIEPSSGKWLKQKCDDEKTFMCKVPANPQPTCPPPAPVLTCPTPSPAPTCPQPINVTVPPCPACPSTPVHSTCPPPAAVPSCPPPPPVTACPSCPYCPPQLPPATCPSAAQPSSSSCPSGFTSCSGSNYCYQVVATSNSQPQAEAQCQQLGGNLATIDSPSATQCLLSMTSSLAPSRIWIGLYDIMEDPHHTKYSQWTWLDGSPYSYYNWGTAMNEPNNLGGTEWCVDVLNGDSYDTPGTWNDEECNNNIPALCSVPLQNN